MPDKYTINLTDSDAGTDDVCPGDKITWHNSTDSIITLAPPSCVAPSNEEQINAGSDGISHTVNNGANGTYDYTFTVGAALATRNGKIKV